MFIMRRRTESRFPRNGGRGGGGKGVFGRRANSNAKYRVVAKKQIGRSKTEKIITVRRRKTINDLYDTTVVTKVHLEYKP